VFNYVMRRGLKITPGTKQSLSQARANHWATSPPFRPPLDFDRASKTSVSSSFLTLKCVIREGLLCCPSLQPPPPSALLRPPLPLVTRSPPPTPPRPSRLPSRQGGCSELSWRRGLSCPLLSLTYYRPRRCSFTQRQRGERSRHGGLGPRPWGAAVAPLDLPRALASRRQSSPKGSTRLGPVATSNQILTLSSRWTPPATMCSMQCCQEQR
jgi:hypothetical protein